MRFSRSTIVTLVAATALATGACSTPATSGARDAVTELDRSATLSIAYYRAAPTLDPHSTPTTVDEPLLWPVYDRLMRMNEAGDVEPALATAWEFTAEGLHLTLREGVRFQDGTPLDAQAVKANLDRAKSLPTSAVKADLASVTAVDVLDASHVLLRSSDRDVALPLVLAARAGAMISPAAMTSPELGTKPVGAGPYRVTSVKAGDSVVYERFEGYWDFKDTRPARIELKVVTDAATRLNALRAGQVDIANIDPGQVAEVEGLPSLAVAIGKDVKVTVLQVNPALAPPLGDVRVRRAINYAIDREAIVQGVLFGQGEPTTQPFPKGYFAHSAKGDDAYPYDPARAQALLAEAGYPQGFTFTTLLGGAPSVSEAEAVQGQLAKVGITMEIERVQGNKGVERFWRDKSAPALLVPWGGRPDPSMTLGAWFGPGGVSNPGNVTSGKVSDLLARAKTEQDKAKRASILQQVSADLVDNPLSVVPLWHPYTAYGHAKRVTSLPLPLAGGVEFQNITISK